MHCTPRKHVNTLSFNKKFDVDSEAKPCTFFVKCYEERSFSFRSSLELLNTLKLVFSSSESIAGRTSVCKTLIARHRNSKLLTPCSKSPFCANGLYNSEIKEHCKNCRVRQQVKDIEMHSRLQPDSAIGLVLKQRPTEASIQDFNQIWRSTRTAQTVTYGKGWALGVCAIILLVVLRQSTHASRIFSKARCAGLVFLPLLPIQLLSAEWNTMRCYYVALLQSLYPIRL